MIGQPDIAFLDCGAEKIKLAHEAAGQRNPGQRYQGKRKRGRGERRSARQSGIIVQVHVQISLAG